MEIIKNLGCLRDKNGSYYSVAIFKCPYCLQEVTRRLSSGKIAKSCGCGTKKLQSIAQKERFKNKENHPMYGKKHTEESRLKMKESREGMYVGEKNPMYGKSHTEETRQK